VNLFNAGDGILKVFLIILICESKCIFLIEIMCFISVINVFLLFLLLIDTIKL